MDDARRQFNRRFARRARFTISPRAVCLLLLLVPALAGCGLTQTAATIPFIPLERTATPRITPGLPATASALATAASDTPTPAPTQSATPYMGVDFSLVELTQGGFLSDLRYFVTFEFPDPVEGEYRAVVDQNKDYKCVVLPDYLNRLYCSGPLVRVYNWADIDLYADGIDQPVWSGKFFIPQME